MREVVGNQHKIVNCKLENKVGITWRKGSKRFVVSLSVFSSNIMKNCYFWMIFHDMVTLSNIGKHLVLSQYAISSRSYTPNSRKWSQTFFWLFGSFKTAFFFDFWLILHDLVMLQNGRKRSVLSQYAISS